MSTQQQAVLSEPTQIDHQEFISSRFEKQDHDLNSNIEYCDDERIDLPCVWVAECFTPSMLPSLLQNIASLGWDEDNATATRPTSVDTWIHSMRWSSDSAGWMNLSNIVRPEERDEWLLAPFTAPLPECVDHANGTLYQLVSGVLVLVMQFHIRKDAIAPSIDNALKKDYSTYYNPLARGGARWISPPEQRRQEIEKIRIQSVRSCSSWFSDYLPGIFASMGDPDAFVTGELLTLDKGKLQYEDLPWSWEHYQRALGMQDSLDLWTSPGFLGMAVRTPNQSEYNNIRVYAGPRETLAQIEAENPRLRVSRYGDWLVGQLLASWAVSGLVSVYEIKYLELRDTLIDGLAGSRSDQAIELASDLEEALLAIGSDAIFVSKQLRSHLMAGIPLVSDTPKLTTAFCAGVAGGVGEVGQSTELNQDEHGEQFANTEKDLHNLLGQSILRRCEWLLSVDTEVRHSAEAQSRLAHSRVQREGESANIKLQKRLWWLSVIVTIATVVQVTLALIQHWPTLRSLIVFW